jgi:hypothetical protein
MLLLLPLHVPWSLRLIHLQCSLSLLLPLLLLLLYTRCRA